MVVHVARDVVVVDELQDAPVLIAVEDDEVEILDLVREQLLGREGDERELIDRRAVLLLGRAQNGEVHEIDGGVRLQEIAPRALAGMRLARDEEDAQVLAHALGDDDEAVVGGGELARRRLELDLEDVGAGVRERHLDLDRAADLGAHRLVGATFAADLEGDAALLDGFPSSLADGDLDVARLADEAVARHRQGLDAPVELAGRAGEEGMHRGLEAKGRGLLRHVVDLAVGDEDDAREAVGGRVGERLVELGEELRALSRRGAGLGADHPLHLEVRDFRELSF